jgi:hypothetical protein
MPHRTYLRVSSIDREFTCADESPARSRSGITIISFRLIDRMKTSIRPRAHRPAEATSKSGLPHVRYTTARSTRSLDEVGKKLHGPHKRGMKTKIIPRSVVTDGLKRSLAPNLCTGACRQRERCSEQHTGLNPTAHRWPQTLPVFYACPRWPALPTITYGHPVRAQPGQPPGVDLGNTSGCSGHFRRVHKQYSPLVDDRIHDNLSGWQAYECFACRSLPA